MKAFVVTTLFAAASAAVLINDQYATVNANGQCVAQPGFALSGYTGDGESVPFGSPNAFPVANGTSCKVPAGDAVAVQCADGWTAVGTPSGVVTTAAASGGGSTNTTNSSTGGGSTVDVDDIPAGFATDYDIQNDTTFTCARVACNYTCTTQHANGTTGSGCNASGQILPGAKASSVCNTGFVSNSNFTCPADGSTTTQQIVCSNSIIACLNAGDNAAITACVAAVSRGSGFSLPGSCTCVQGAAVTPCPNINANSPSCSQCVLPCNIAENAANPPLVAGRQDDRLNAARAAMCPTGVDTLQEYNDCFQQAACSGAINPATDICLYGGSADCAQGRCPHCDDSSSSKKGLLGLLGLLALIPLLLCLLLLCLLCCIRRKKTERDVHFATFDAGAPSVAAPVPVMHEEVIPVCHDIAPVCQDFQTVHHSTFVGPEHMHGPEMGGPMGGSMMGSPMMGGPSAF